MKHNFKKILSIILAAVMCLSAFPMAVWAADEEAVVANCPECFNNTNVVASDKAPNEEPTCTEPAGTWYKCTNAEAHKSGLAIEFILPEAGSVAHHSNPEKVTHVAKKEATCTEVGNEEFWYCSECDFFYATAAMVKDAVYGKGEDIDAIPEAAVIDIVTEAHNWGEWETVTAPVCGVSDGEAKRVCAINPEHVETKVIPGYDHNYTLVEDSYKNVGCLTDVELVFVCTNEGCEDSYTKLGKGWAHELVCTEASANKCHEAGNTEYYTCLACGNYYAVAGENDTVAFEADDVKYTQIEKNSWVIAASHTPVKTERVEATCLTNGNVEYYTCTNTCGKIYADEACTVELTETVIAKTGHNFNYTQEKVEPTCTATGSMASKHCANCDLWFTVFAKAFDKNGKTIDAFVIPMLNHVADETVEAVAGNCTTVGTVAYKTCKTCDSIFAATDADDDLQNKLENEWAAVTMPSPEGKKETVEVAGDGVATQHNWVIKEVKEATCTADGSIVWVCADCDAFTNPADWANGLGVHVFYIPKTNHADATRYEAVAPTCNTKGSYAYAHCEACDKYFAVDAEGNVIINIAFDDATTFVDAIDFDGNNHATNNYGRVYAKEATCSEDGINADFWVCMGCLHVIVDEADGERTLDIVCDNAFDAEQHYIGTIPTEFVAPKHEQTLVDAVAPQSCAQAGNIAYYECSCGAFYYGVDTEGEIDFEITYTAEELVVTIDHTLADVAATVNCAKDGMIAHKVCTYEDCTVKYFDVDGNATTKEALEMTKEDYIEENGHVWDGEYKAPTDCVDAEHRGEAGYNTCSVCFYEEVITQHAFTVIVWDVEPTCTDRGTWHYECVRCSAKEVDANADVIINKGSDFKSHVEMGWKHVAAKDNTCFENGNVQYWECKGCKAKFANANMTEESKFEKDGEVIPAAHESVSAYINHVGGCTDECTAEDCTIDAHKVAQYKCADCEMYSMTEDFAEGSSTPYGTAAAHTGEIEQTAEYVDSTCLVVGQRDVWTCSECGAKFLDAEATVALEEGADIIPVKDHNGEYVAAVDATCTATGNIAHFSKCTNGCENIYGVNEDGSINLDVVYTDVETAKINHTAGAEQLTEEVKSVCTVLGEAVTDGNIAYYTCTVCNQKFDAQYGENPAADTEALTDETIKNVPHVPEFTPVAFTYVPATCTEVGYYVMACDCGYYYYQFTAPIRHNVTVKHEGLTPDCDDHGYNEFYYCANCEQSYTDANCTNPTTDAEGNIVVWDSLEDAIIPATDKHYNAAGDLIVPGCSLDVDRLCQTCNSRKDADKTYEHKEFVSITVEANCVNPYTTYDQCVECGFQKNVVTEGEPSGEHPVKALVWNIVTDAACNVEGLKAEFCSHCEKETGKTEVIPALVHNYAKNEDGSNWIITNETCTSNGKIEKYCQNGCGTFETEVIDEIDGHVPGEWTLIEGIEKPYEADEAEAKYCEVCGEICETRPMQDIYFSIDVDNAVVSGAEYVNSGKIAVTINVSAYKRELSALKLKFSYKNLTFDSVEYGAFGDNFAWREYSAKNNTFTISVMPADAVNVDVNGQDLEFITVYFTIDAAAATETSAFEIYDLEVVKCIDENDAVVENINTQDDVKIAYTLLGDVNGDGDVDLIDAQRIISALQTGKYDAHADFDKNGYIEVADFAALLKFDAEAYTYEQLVLPETRPAA